MLIGNHHDAIIMVIASCNNHNNHAINVLWLNYYKIIKQRKLATAQQDNNYCVIMVANKHKYQHFNLSLSFPTLSVRLNGGT